MKNLTTKNLLALVKNNGGTFKIGGLTFSKRDNDCDLDVFFNDRNLMWIPASGDIQLSLDKAFRVNNDYFVDLDKMRSLHKENEQLKDQLKRDKEIIESFEHTEKRLAYADGKLEIYEQLFNRDVTITAKAPELKEGQVCGRRTGRRDEWGNVIY